MVRKEGTGGAQLAKASGNKAHRVHWMQRVIQWGVLRLYVP